LGLHTAYEAVETAQAKGSGNGPNGKWPVAQADLRITQLPRSLAIRHPLL
jgi:hypothetical protein